MQLYDALCTEAQGDNIRAWELIPQMHTFLHLTQDAGKWGNPRYLWLYADEHVVGASITIVRSCHLTKMVHLAILEHLVSTFTKFEDH